MVGKMLYFDRSTLAAYNKRFLAESKGKVTHLELDCLKPHIGNSNIMDDTQKIKMIFIRSSFQTYL